MQQIRDFKIQQEDFYTVKEEVDELFYKHWEEVADNKDKIKLNPDWSFYEQVYLAGNLGVYTIRHLEKLVGYFVVIARSHPHYKDHIFASNDIVFIDPEYRKGLAGYFLIKYAEQDLKDKGVSVLMINVRVRKPFDAVLQRLGFSKVERQYSKYIGE